MQITAILEKCLHVLTFVFLYLKAGVRLFILSSIFFLKRQETSNDGIHYDSTWVFCQTENTEASFAFYLQSIHNLWNYTMSRIVFDPWRHESRHTKGDVRFLVCEVKDVKFPNVRVITEGQHRAVACYFYSLRQVQWYLCTWASLSVLSAILAKVAGLPWRGADTIRSNFCHFTFYRHNESLLKMW